MKQDIFIGVTLQIYENCDQVVHQLIKDFFTMFFSFVSSDNFVGKVWHI